MATDHLLLKALNTYNTSWILTACLLIAGVVNALAQSPQQADSLLAEFKKAQHDTTRIDVLHALTQAYISSDFDQSRRYATKALEIAERINDLNRMSGTHGLIGNIDFRQGDYTNAFERYLKAARLAEEVDNQWQLARLYSSMGLVNTYQKNYPKAQEYYIKSLEQKTALGDSIGMANTLQFIGSNHFRQHNYDEAVKWFKQSLAIGDALQHQQTIMYCLNNIGAVQYKAAKYDDALEHYLRGLAIAEAKGDLKSQSGLLLNIGRLWNRKGEKESQPAYLDTSLVYMERSLEMAQQLKSKEDIWQAYGALYDLYDVKGDYKKANEYLLGYHQMKDSLVTEQSTQQINQLMAEYEAEKKDRDIAELRLEKEAADAKTAQQRLWLLVAGCLLIGGGIIVFLYNGRRKATVKHRMAELEQKALRAQMNPHFIFNSLASLQRMYVDGQTDRANDFMADFGQLMRKILDNTGKRLISVHEEMETLRLYTNLEMGRLDGQLTCKLEVNEDIDRHGTFVPPMVLQPIVENAIWHGIVPKGNGTVAIHLSMGKNDKLLLATVQDNGIGIEQSKADKKSTLHESKGMNITAERLGGNGAMTVSQLATGGTEVTLKIPVEYGH